MKKILSILLIITMLLLNCGMSVAAVSNQHSADAIRNQFKAGSNEDIYDYYYYSPVKSSSDTTKYPVILWLHGQLSGDYKGHQIRQSDVVYLSTEENQAKIKGTGGAFILVPRYPTLNVSLAWTGENSNLKKFVDEFISEHKDNIDTNRIYVGGYSMGGKAAMKFAATHSNFVAAVFPVSAIYLLASADSDIKGLINTPYWFFICKEDDFWGKPTPQSADWNLLCSISNRKNDIRWTQFTRIDSSGKDVGLFNYDGSRIIMIGYNEHNVWDPVLHDLVMKSGSMYPNMTTVDGNNKVVHLTAEESFLSWLSSQSLNGVIGEEGGSGDSTDNNQGGSIGNIGGSGKVFYHIREILEYVITLFDRVYKALFTII